MRISGIKKVDFVGKDGTQVSGKTIFLAIKIAPERGSGEEFERIFLSRSKLERLNFEPELNQVVKVSYNRFGKVDSLELLDDLLIE